MKELRELSLKEKLEAYKEAKRYVTSEYPKLCVTKEETMQQAYDEAVQYGIDFGY